MSDLKVFVTAPHPCSYLADREAVTLFLDPDAVVDKSLYSQLSDIGFRRSGENVYRPHCVDCNQCQASRINAKKFIPSRSQKRIANKNKDLVVEKLTSIDNDRCYELYSRYINSRHRDGDMYPATRQQYRSFLSAQWGITAYLGFYLEHKLVAVAVIDEMDTGMAAVYTFFCPDQTKRSLGVFAVLKQIELVKSTPQPFVYLGYYIKDCEKMSYKSNYYPLEVLRCGRWVELIATDA